jgi:hypothetical protein
MTKRKREIGDDEEIIIVDSKQHSDITVEQKWAIVAFCMEDYDTKTRKLGYGHRKLAMTRFDIGKQTVNNILVEYMDQIQNNILYPNLNPKSREYCGLVSSHNHHSHPI